MPEEIVENENQINKKRESSTETKAEKESDVFRGAQMLEEPPAGNYNLGLQTFINWVKSLLASDDDN